MAHMGWQLNFIIIDSYNLSVLQGDANELVMDTTL
jgi:hypothetical protein